MGKGGWPVSRRKRRRKKFLVFLAFAIFFVFLAFRGGRDENGIPMPPHWYQPEVEIKEAATQPETEPEEEIKTVAFYYHRAISRAEDGNLDGAIEDYLRAGEMDPTLSASIDPELSLLYLRRGHTLFEEGRYLEAEEDYAASVGLDPEPEEPRYYFNRGVSFYREDDFKNAVAYYTMAVSIDPEYAFAYLNRGVAYRSKNEILTAVRDYTKALESDPGYALAHFNRGEAYGTIGDYDRALSDFETYLELDPGNPRAGEVRALVADIRRRISR